MSKYGHLKVEVRTTSGKNAAHRLRAAGQAPAVVYGLKKDQLHLSVDSHLLKKGLDPVRRLNTVWNREVVKDGAVVGTERCMITDVQTDPVRDTILHVDFQRVDDAVEVIATIPVVFSGKPAGVTAGGKLRTFRRSVKVAAFPQHLPDIVDLDITTLEGGASLRFRDVVLENARVLESPQTVAALIEMPRGPRGDAAAPDAKKGKK